MEARRKESNLERLVCKLFIKAGWVAFKLYAYNQKGAPDRIFLKNNKTIFIEFKVGNKKLSKLQEYMREVLEGQGFDFYVVRSLKQGKEVLESLK